MSDRISEYMLDTMQNNNVNQNKWQIRCQNICRNANQINRPIVCQIDSQ